MHTALPRFAWRRSEALIALAFAIATGASSFAAPSAASAAVPPWPSLLAGLALAPCLVAALAAVRCAVSRVRPMRLVAAEAPDRRLAARQVLFGVAAGLGLSMPCGLLASLLESLARLLGHAAPSQNSVQWLLSPDTPGAAKAVLASYAFLIAPVCEEILYRGILLTEARRLLPARPALAALAVSALFAFAHGSLLAALPIGIVGMACAELAILNDSLLPGIGLHAAFNAANLAFILLFWNGSPP